MQLLLLQFSYTEEGLPSLHLYYEKSFKGAVSGVAFLQAKQRYIVVSGNNKMIEVLAWKLERSGNYELIKVGFFEAYNYIVDIHVVKSYILFSDAYKSVHFLRLTVSVCALMCVHCVMIEMTLSVAVCVWLFLCRKRATVV